MGLQSCISLIEYNFNLFQDVHLVQTEQTDEMVQALGSLDIPAPSAWFKRGIL